MNMKGIIFDLDGTLLNTLRDLADSVNEGLEALGKPTHALEKYRMFVGNGARMLCTRALNASSPDLPEVDLLLSLFKENYKNYQKRFTSPYPGVPEMLSELQEKQIKMAILSNKPQINTQAIAEFYFPQIKFVSVIGQSESVPPKPDPTGIRCILASFQLPENEVYYLGDSGVDMVTAKNAGLFALGATWGFRGREELLQHGADLLVDHPSKLISLQQE